MRKLLASITMLVLFVVLYAAAKSKKNTQITLPDIPDMEEKVEIDGKHKVFLSEINEIRRKTKSLCVRDMPIKLRTASMSFNCFGDLCYEREKRFRLVVRHRISGKEMDIGSNDEGFWFWSKRMDPPLIYFCHHVNAEKSQLKCPLQPSWILRCLGVHLIAESEVVSITQDQDNIFLKEKGVGGNGEEVFYLTIFDKSTRKPKGMRLLGENGHEYAKTAFEGEKILLQWLDEGVYMEWDLREAIKNKNIESSLWDVPALAKVIDMGR
jgi:hypothetical protein